MNEETHQVNSGVQLRNEFQASLLAIFYFGQGLGGCPLSELGGERAQAYVVARLLHVKAFHGFRFQLCHKGRKT